MHDQPGAAYRLRRYAAVVIMRTLARNPNGQHRRACVAAVNNHASSRASASTRSGFQRGCRDVSDRRQALSPRPYSSWSGCPVVFSRLRPIAVANRPKDGRRGQSASPTGVRVPYDLAQPYQLFPLVGGLAGRASCNLPRSALLTALLPWSSMSPIKTASITSRNVPSCQK